jgi:hypothetical protein
VRFSRGAGLATVQWVGNDVAMRESSFLRMRTKFGDSFVHVVLVWLVVQSKGAKPSNRSIVPLIGDRVNSTLCRIVNDTLEGRAQFRLALASLRLPCDETGTCRTITDFYIKDVGFSCEILESRANRVNVARYSSGKCPFMRHRRCASEKRR